MIIYLIFGTILCTHQLLFLDNGDQNTESFLYPSMKYSIEYNIILGTDAVVSRYIIPYLISTSNSLLQK